MIFENSFWAILIIPVFFFAISALVIAKKKKEALSACGILPGVYGLSWPKRLVLILISAIFLVLLSFGLMKPISGYDEITVKKKGREILFVVDISRSMRAMDVKPSRIKRVQYLLHDFISELRGDRVGLIAFSSQAYVLVPFTSDYELFLSFVDEFDREMTSGQGTDFTSALEKIQLLMDKSQQKNHLHAVVLSDGENQESGNNSLVAKLHQEGVVLHSIGIGTQEGAPIPDENGEFKRDENGKTIISRLESRSLQEMAEKGGGQYLEDLSDNPIKRILNQVLMQDEGQVFKEDVRKVPRSLQSHFAILALILVFVGLIISDRRWGFQVLFFCFFLFTSTSVQAGVFDLFDLSPEILSYNQGNLLYQNEEYDKALSAYSKSLASSDARLQRNALYNMGNSYFRKQDYAAAIEYYKKALEVDAQHEASQYNLKIAEEMLRKKDESQKEEKKDDQNQNQQEPQQDQKESQEDRDQTEQKDSQENNSEQDQQQNQNAEPNPEKEEQQNQDAQGDEEKDEGKEDSQGSKSENSENKEDDEKSDSYSESSEKNSGEDKGSDGFGEKLDQTWQDPTRFIEGVEDNTEKTLQYILESQKQSGPSRSKKDW